jgi:hypothetical protein
MKKKKTEVEISYHVALREHICTLLLSIRDDFLAKNDRVRTFFSNKLHNVIYKTKINRYHPAI